MLPAENADALVNHSSSSLGDVELPGVPLTQAQVDAFIAMVEASSSSLVDINVQQIVAEETAAFFAGDKTADQVCDIIQNRVTIYLDERS
jgi:siroheme synthase